MQYQSFRGADVREALSRVRESLGPDAMIQSTRQVTNGRGGALGRSWVEVTAAAPSGRASWPFSPDGRQTVASQAPGASLRAGATPRHRTAVDTSPFGALRGRTPTLGLDAAALERELLSLRAMLSELSASRPPKERALGFLSKIGIEGALARELATGAGQMARRGAEALNGFLAQRVAERLSIGGDPLDQPGRQLVAMVGNTGVGKTTTLAKLAARARLEHRRSVTVLSLDSYRVGAVEQWQRYAALMGIPFHPLRGPEDFAERISDCRSDIILLDTTGKTGSSSMEDWPVVECLDVAGAGDRCVHSLLVLPAWMRSGDAERVFSCYRDARPTGLVVSKLDETCQVGGILHAAIPNSLPLTYFCDGPRVPEDIHLASVERIVSTILAECS